MTTIGLTVAGLLLVAASAFGQVPGGQLSGRVTDDGGSGLPGASVEIRPSAGGPARQTVTSNAGEYEFADVAPGRYKLSFTLINFASVVRNNEGKGQREEGRGQRAEGRGQRAEGRGQRAKGRGQR